MDFFSWQGSHFFRSLMLCQNVTSRIFLLILCLPVSIAFALAHTRKKNIGTLLEENVLALIYMITHFRKTGWLCSYKATMHTDSVKVTVPAPWHCQTNDANNFCQLHDKVTIYVASFPPLPLCRCPWIM